ncbi:MAG: biotin carboxyl carrier protein [Chlamydiales bacterium]|jgi:biotin carboxyl carrier protein
MSASIELRAEQDGERWLLRVPEAGIFTCAQARGAALAAGQTAGVLLRLGRAAPLVVPAGVRGIVTSPRPAHVHAPVGAGEVLYELSSIGSGDLLEDQGAPEENVSPGGNPVVVAPQAGRFYVSPSPTEPPFVSPGSALHDGVAIGMIEIMKTFTQILYRAENGLPGHATVLRVLAADGSDVAAGDALIELAAEDGGVQTP